MDENVSTDLACDSVTLSESDIDGASLKEPFEKHTVSELRWWLLCRGIVAPTSFKKQQIIDK